MYLDTALAIKKQLEWIDKHEGSARKILGRNFSELGNTIDIDSIPFIYGKGAPFTPEAVELHHSTLKEYKERNSETGINHNFLGNMALILLFQYWEDYHRALIATDLGISKDELKNPIMSDLRLIRNSIIHNRGFAKEEVENCMVFQWYKKGNNPVLHRNPNNLCL